jgi:hypothetical protein
MPRADVRHAVLDVLLAALVQHDLGAERATMSGPDCTRCASCGTPTCGCCTVMVGARCASCQSRVELVPAFAWTCPDCGSRNFVEGVLAELTPDERREAEEVLGSGDFVARPDEVTCYGRCGRTFVVEQLGESLSDDELREMLGR